MKTIIGDNTYLRIKRLKRMSIIRLIVFSLVFVLVIVFSFVFQNRSNDHLFTILLALSTTLYVALVIYEVRLNLLAYKNYLKIINHRLQVREIEVIFLGLDSMETYLGVTCNKLAFFDEKEEKKYFYYVEELEEFDFKENKKYLLHDYHRFIISYEEINNE